MSDGRLLANDGTDLSFVEGLGVPVDSSHPGWHFIASFDRASAVPTEREVRMIRSYIEYACVSDGSYYRESYGRRILDLSNHQREGQPQFPMDAGHNTVIFHKRADDDWGFRRSTFTRGPAFAPQPATGHGPKLDLAALLDYINHDWGHKGDMWTAPPRSDWVAWKEAHPEVFST